MTTHGSDELPGVAVKCYSLNLKDGGGFVGDRASGRAFFNILGELRAPLCQSGTDPFGGVTTDSLSNDDVDEAWKCGDAFAAGLVHTSIEIFAQQLASVVRAYRSVDEHWAMVERVVVGGGLRDSRVGEIAIGRTTAILRLEGIDVDLVPILSDPDEAALLGGLHLIEAASLRSSSRMLAVDIGGSSIRVGIILFDPNQPDDLSRASVIDLDQWKYAENKNEPSRDEATERLVLMLDHLERQSDKPLSPFITVACPGRISKNGDIREGAQNLPGNWEADDFNLPTVLADAFKGKYKIVMHNDAVVQGLSELPRMRDVGQWAVITIGTGLGNAVYVNPVG